MKDTTSKANNCFAGHKTQGFREIGFFLTRDRAGMSNAEQETPPFAMQQRRPLYGEQSHDKKKSAL